jgi:hypothetical protein
VSAGDNQPTETRALLRPAAGSAAWDNLDSRLQLALNLSPRFQTPV